MNNTTITIIGIIAILMDIKFFKKTVKLVFSLAVVFLMCLFYFLRVINEVEVC